MVKPFTRIVGARSAGFSAYISTLLSLGSSPRSPITGKHIELTRVSQLAVLCAQLTLLPTKSIQYELERGREWLCRGKERGSLSHEATNVAREGYCPLDGG